MGCAQSSARNMPPEPAEIPTGAEVPTTDKTKSFLKSLFEQSGSVRKIALGECFIVQGQLNQSAFYIDKGEIDLKLSGETGEQKLVTRKSGDLLGEISLLLGIPSSVSAIAATDVTVLEVKQDQLMAQLRDDPSRAGYLFRAIATTLAERISELSGIMRSNVVHPQHAKTRKSHAIGATDMARVRAQFGLNKDEKLHGVYSCSVLKEVNAVKDDQAQVGELFIFEVSH